jgi:predicted AAA+ superfamily ATPase
MQISHLFELNALAKKQVESFDKKRFIFDSVRSKTGKHFTGIVGPRGVGKTVILKQLAREIPDSLYVSIDTLDGMDLFELVNRLSSDYGIRHFFLDEVHFDSQIDSQLKKIYDFLDVRIVFTSSVALAMIESSYDLSRRVNLIQLLPFSFREYIYFREGTILDPLTILDLYHGDWQADHLRFGYMFETFLRGGLMPFALEDPEPLPLLKNILDKVLMKDLPTVKRLGIDEVGLIRKMLKFMGSSEVDGINLSSLSRNVGITKYKAEQYVDLLEKAFVINVVYPKGTNVMKEGKVLLGLPYRLLYKSYDGSIGGLREDYFVEMAKGAQLPIFYLKTTRGTKTPDFLVGDGDSRLVVEIGGKGKGRSQFKGIKIDRKMVLAHIDAPARGKVPLLMAGYLY